MAFQFYIDGQLTDQPINDTELSSTIDRSSIDGNVTITQDVSLRWAANNNLQTGEISGFAYLSAMVYDRICNEAAIKIYDEVSGASTVLVYTGVIKVPTIDIDLQRMILTTKIQDNSYFSYLHNNIKIKVKFDATRTKNLEVATPLDYYEMTMFIPNTGVQMPELYKVYDIVEVMGHILFCITDGKVSFASTYLSDLEYPLYICKGQNLTNPISSWPDGQGEMELSLEDALRELNRFYSLSFWMDNTDPDNPVFRLESTDATYGTTLLHTVTDVKELKLSIPTDHLYGVINVGDKNFIAPPCATCYFPHTAAYYGWRDVQFFPLGQCNIDTELELTSEWVIDNNAITDSMMGMNTSTLDYIFAFEGDPATVDTINRTVDAMRHPFFGTGQYYYNEGLNNFNKLQRHATKFEVNFGNFLEQTADTFKAYLGEDNTDNITYVTSPASSPNFLPVAGATVEPVPFANTLTMGAFNYDGNYSTSTYRYTIPTTGDYSFNTYIEWLVQGIQSVEYFDVTVTIVHYDAGNTEIFSNSQYQLCAVNGVYNINIPYVGYCAATDYIQVKLRVVYKPNGVQNQQIARSLSIAYDSFFRCTATATTGVSIYSSNPLIRKYQYDMVAELPYSEWITIANTPIGMIAFEKDGTTYYGWIKELKRNDWTGMSSLKLITNNALTQD